MSKLGISRTLAQFNGLEAKRARAGYPIREEDLGESTAHEGLAVDQAIIYQNIISKDLDGGAYTGQLHNDSIGVNLGWPLSFVNVGRGHTDVITSGVNQKFLFPTIDCSQVSANYERVLFRWPCYIPTGMDYVRVRVEAQRGFAGAMSPIVRRYSSTFVLQTEVEPHVIEKESGSTLWFRLSSNDDAINIFSFDVTIPDYSTDQYYLKNIAVFPDVWAKAWSDLPPRDAEYSADMTAPERGSAFLPIQDTFIGDGKPLSSYITTRLARNDGYIHELLTGTKQPLQTSAATAGHDHDGTDSAHIDCPLFSVGLGWVPVSGADGLNAVEGLNGSAPTLTEDDAASGAGTTCNMARGIIQLPERTGACSLSWAATIYNKESGDCDVTIGTDSEPKATHTNQDTQAADDGEGWDCVIGTVTATEGAINHLLVKMVNNQIKAGTYNTLTGFSLWLTNPA